MSELHTRKEKRTPVTLKIKFKSATLDQFIERYSVDVSHGGIFIRTKDPLAVGTQLRFEFQLQDASPLISGDGTVVWTREFDPSRVGVAPGMGVRFDRLAPESQPVLEQILTRKGGRGVSGEADRFDAISGQAPSLAGMAAASSSGTGEKTRITPPTLASSLVAASSRSGLTGERGAVRAAGTPPQARNAYEEPKDSTPLPKPMPFHIAAEDEFNEDVFEQPTKVASLETLLKHEEEHARQAAEAARAQTRHTTEAGPAPAPQNKWAPTSPMAAPDLPSLDQLDDEPEEKTNVVAKRKQGSGARPRPSPPEKASQPEPVLTADSLDDPTPHAGSHPPSFGAPSRATSEPRFLDSMPHPGHTPVELAHTLPQRRQLPPAPAAQATSKQGKGFPLVAILVAALLIVAAAAALYVFVIKPSSEEQGAPRRPAAAAVTPPASAPASAVKPSEPAPAPVAPVVPPQPTKGVEVAFDTKPVQATISIDGAPANPAPVTARLEIGKVHQIVASAACHKDETLTIDAKADSAAKQTIKLKPLDRVVRVTTEPPGAMMLIDGKPAGRTPTEVRMVGRLDARSEHVFTFRKVGFEETVTKVPPDAACATDGDVGVVGLSLTLAPVAVRKPAPPAPAPAPAVVRKPPPAPVRAAPQPKPVTPKPAAAPPPVTEPKAEEPKPEPRPEPVETKPDELPQKAEEPKAEPPPAPKPEPAKTEPPAAPPKTEPEKPKAEDKPKAEQKDCDPSPDAPDWARCK